MPDYLRHLSYCRLICLLLAVGQLMLLPDAPKIHRNEIILPMARLFPDDNQPIAE